MRKSFLLLIIASTLAACGLKGPLYLPQPKPATAPPAAAPAPQTPIEDNKTPGTK
jgi:predicted small lipoprotein YifL